MLFVCEATFFFRFESPALLILQYFLETSQGAKKKTPKTSPSGLVVEAEPTSVPPRSGV